MRQTFRLSRRGFLALASSAGVQPWFRLYGGDSDFWNKKEPSQWSSEEIDRLSTKSPWAKQVTASAPLTERPYGNRGGGGSGPTMGDPGIGGGNGGGYPGGGYPGGGGRGGGYGGGGRRGGGGAPTPIQYKGVVRWESAKPLQEALKTPLPEGLAQAYVISVSGIPILAASTQHADDGDSPTTVSKGASDEVLDRIKNLTYLEPKGKSPAQPAVVQKASISSGGTNTLLFVFPRDVLVLTPDDKEVTFTTQLGKLEIKTKFNLKDMMYHKELAL